MFKLMTTFVLSFLYIQTLTATPYTTDDFAHIATLTDAKTSLRQLDFPEILYKKIRRNDYADLRVFSVDGQVVPHQFSRPESIRSTAITSLVFYPFSKEQAANSSNIQIFLNKKTGNQKIGEQKLIINQQIPGNTTTKNNEYQYIIENSKSKPALCKIKLDWAQAKPSMILAFKLESSANLQHWKTLSQKLTISKLDYAGSQLIRNEVSFPCTSKKYLRLTWLKPHQQTHVKHIQGIYTQNNAPQVQWKSFAKPRYDEQGNWLFESNVVAAISKMEFVAPQDGLLYKGMLYSRNDEKQAWRFLQKISQYRLNIGETNMQSSAFSLKPNNDRYWKLSMTTEGRFREDQLPEIRVDWTSKQLLFLAQGKGPFTLAFGNPAINPTQSNDLNALYKTFKDTGVSVDKVTLGAISDNQKSFETELPWKLIFLWSILILGTMLMAFMAYRLYQQMGKK